MKREEEKEVERKARAKRARESRRSTQVCAYLIGAPVIISASLSFITAPVSVWAVVVLEHGRTPLWQIVWSWNSSPVNVVGHRWVER